MRQLFPSPPGTGDADLAALYAYPPGPWLRANMVASADGAASLGGVSGRPVVGRRPAGLLPAPRARRRHRGRRGHGPGRRLRARAAQPSSGPTCGTAGPRLPPSRWSARGWTSTPASRLFTEAAPDARTIVITSAAAPQDLRAELARHADVITAGEAAIDLDAAVRALADRGHRRMLTEGGPHLLAQLAAAGLLDELCLTIGPLLAGPGADRIVTGHPFPAGPLPLTLAHVLEDSGFLLCRYTRKTPLSRTAVVLPPRQPATAAEAAPARTRPPRRRRGR